MCAKTIRQVLKTSSEVELMETFLGGFPVEENFTQNFFGS